MGEILIGETVKSLAPHFHYVLAKNRHKLRTMKNEYIVKSAIRFNLKKIVEDMEIHNRRLYGNDNHDYKVYNRSLGYALSCGYIELFELMLKAPITDTKTVFFPSVNNYEAFRYIDKRLNIDFSGNRTTDFFHPEIWNTGLTEEAARKGNIKVLKFLINNNCPYWKDEIYLSASRSGSIDILDYIYSVDSTDINIRDADTFEGGFKTDNLTVLKWFNDRGQRFHSYDIYSAIEQNAKQCAEYLVSLDFPPDEVIVFNPKKITSRLGTVCRSLVISIIMKSSICINYIFDRLIIDDIEKFIELCMTVPDVVFKNKAEFKGLIKKYYLERNNYR